MLTTVIAMILLQFTVESASIASRRPKETGYIFTESMYIKGLKKSFHVHMVWNNATVIMGVFDNGIIILVKMSQRLQPSMVAASSSSRGIPRKN